MLPNEQRSDLVSESATVHHEIGHLWFLNMLVWGSSMMILGMIAWFSTYSEIYRVPGVQAMGSVGRVWGIGESEFAALPELTDDGIRYSEQVEMQIPEFLRRRATTEATLESSLLFDVTPSVVDDESHDAKEEAP